MKRKCNFLIKSYRRNLKKSAKQEKRENVPNVKIAIVIMATGATIDANVFSNIAD